MSICNICVENPSKYRSALGIGRCERCLRENISDPDISQKTIFNLNKKNRGLQKQLDQLLEVTQLCCNADTKEEALKIFDKFIVDNFGEGR